MLAVFVNFIYSGILKLARAIFDNLINNIVTYIFSFFSMSVIIYLYDSIIEFFIQTYSVPYYVITIIFIYIVMHFISIILNYKNKKDRRKSSLNFNKLSPDQQDALIDHYAGGQTRNFRVPYQIDEPAILAELKDLRYIRFVRDEIQGFRAAGPTQKLYKFTPEGHQEIKKHIEQRKH